MMSGLRITALAGGVGGAKLVSGLALVLQPQDLSVIVNTGDDFIHLGMRICPDLDTVCYTLAGIANPETGWGRVNETWNVYSNLTELGMPNWFKLGDNDLATHIARTVRLSQGWNLSQITSELCLRWGVNVQVFPMSDDFIETVVVTDDGDLGFQEYFVHQECRPIVKEIKFQGVEHSLPAPGVLNAITQADAVVICPSNPWVSIDPILAVPGIRATLEGKLVLSVSPLIGGKAVKGPAAKMFIERGINPSPFAVAEHYGSIIDGILIDRVDAQFVEKINALGIHPVVTDILMPDQYARGRVASELIEIIRNWGR
jgi:LPPG:FO 2-phospho-L-lactate transferase